MAYSNIFYVLAAVLFILGIKKLSHPKTARNGNFIAASGMLIAILATLLSYDAIAVSYTHLTLPTIYSV